MLVSNATSELLICRGIEDISKILFLFLNENICCDLSLEPSRCDGSNGGSQNIFYGEIWLINPKLSLLLLLSVFSGAMPCCWKSHVVVHSLPKLEPSQQDISNEGSQHVVVEK